MSEPGEEEALRKEICAENSSHRKISLSSKSRELPIKVAKFGAKHLFLCLLHVAKAGSKQMSNTNHTGHFQISKIMLSPKYYVTLL